MGCALCKDKLHIDLTAFSKDVFSGLTFDFTILPDECRYCGQHYLPHSDVQILRNKIMDDIDKTGDTTPEILNLLKKLSGSN